VQRPRCLALLLRRARQAEAAPLDLRSRCVGAAPSTARSPGEALVQVPGEGSSDVAWLTFSFGHGVVDFGKEMGRDWDRGKNISQGEHHAEEKRRHCLQASSPAAAHDLHVGDGNEQPSGLRPRRARLSPKTVVRRACGPARPACTSTARARRAGCFRAAQARHPPMPAESTHSGCWFWPRPCCVCALLSRATDLVSVIC
jgi:hypothetical protein